MFGYIAVYYYNFLSEHAKSKVISYMEIEILASEAGARQG